MDEQPVEATEQQMPVRFEVEGHSARRRSWVPYGLAMVAVVVLAAVAVTLIASNRRSQYGSRLASAGALPPSTVMYMSVDFEDLGNFGRMIDAFDGAAADAGIDADADVLDLMDEMVLSGFGMSVADFEPWIGRDVGVAILDLNLDSEGLETDPGSAVLVASVRDSGEADLFMPKMVRAMTDLGMQFEQDMYGDVEVWVTSSGDSSLGELGGAIVLGRSGDAVLLASDEQAMRAAIDAQQGESLRDSDAFRRVVDELPSDRALTMYMGPDLFRSLADVASSPDLGITGFADIESALDNVAGMGVSLSIADEGVRFDYVQVATEASDGDRLTPQDGSQRIAEALPGDTFAYVGVGEWDVADAFATLEGAIADAGFEQTIADVEQEFGIDLRQDVVNLLSGEIGFGLFPAQGGLIAELGGPQVGGLFVLGLSDPDAFASTIERFNRFATDNGVPLDEQQSEGGVVYGVSPDGGESVWYGVSDGFFAAGTDRMLASTAGARLADSALWKEMRSVLDTDGAPLFYVDVATALDRFGVDSDVRRDLEPLRAVSAASVTGDRFTRVTLVALVDY